MYGKWLLKECGYPAIAKVLSGDSRIKKVVGGTFGPKKSKRLA